MDTVTIGLAVINGLCDLARVWTRVGCGCAWQRSSSGGGVRDRDREGDREGDYRESGRRGNDGLENCHRSGAGVDGWLDGR